MGVGLGDGVEEGDQKKEGKGVNDVLVFVCIYLLVESQDSLTGPGLTFLLSRPALDVVLTKPQTLKVLVLSWS